MPRPQSYFGVHAAPIYVLGWHRADHHQHPIADPRLANYLCRAPDGTVRTRDRRTVMWGDRPRSLCCRSATKSPRLSMRLAEKHRRTGGYSATRLLTGHVAVIDRAYGDPASCLELSLQRSRLVDRIQTRAMPAYRLIWGRAAAGATPPRATIFIATGNALTTGRPPGATLGGGGGSHEVRCHSNSRQLHSNGQMPTETTPPISYQRPLGC